MLFANLESAWCSLEKAKYFSPYFRTRRRIFWQSEYFKDGGHNPEKFMEIGQLTKVGGILLPTSLKTYWTKDGQPGEYITKIDITEISFQKNLPENYFEMPRGAKVL